ncbi:stalk domain-containing protein [Paenibacillus nasutitermitis]|uniref:Copper amine oxidase-like N-terminal domain-containing protein n=1 Tax=Paenibacillus nasutitermitis TaxID=1652958 RepID=A0A916YQZ8_9BACL|nr:stalk domain-containing protein [Paenibacillus nasutitermitis]GGD57331.1 hypothetical protein GCM10010911_13910 [Paenibacillus nasutitermitis]
MRFQSAGLAALLVSCGLSAGNTASALPADPAAQQISNLSNADQTSGALNFTLNSTSVQAGNKSYLSPRPMAVKNGVSYVGLRFMAERLGAKVLYDARTKETLVSSGTVELRYVTGSKTFKINGKAATLKGIAYADRNILMVPLTSFTQGLGLPYQFNGKKITVQLEVKPIASFRVQQSEIIAGETMVSYEPSSSSPRGLAIVDERWEGRQDTFSEPGSYTVSYSVMDEDGMWSDPYIQTLQVSRRNEAPVALFATDKGEYRMGEPVTITDQSTDDEDAITDRVWTNNEGAFFEPGTVTITLIVTDKHGASSEFRKDIRVLSEALYTEKEFRLLFTPQGKNIAIDGSAVKTMNALPYTYTTEPETLFRSSGPESVYEDGILYQDVITGTARFLLHHKNKTNRKAKIQVIAQNQGSEPALLHVTGEGLAGPTPHPELAGKLSLSRYFESILMGGSPKSIMLEPGQSMLVFDSLTAANPMSQNDIITFVGELTSDSAITYTSVLVAADKDPFAAFPALPALDPKESIVRGTFADSNRIFEYNDTVGGQTVKLSLTDNREDPFQYGTDGMKGTEAMNSGNYGVMYKLRLYRVAPHTLIAFNPRGGLFTGAALVNDKVINFSHLGTASAVNEASVLYRTGDAEEAVEIWISPSAGSNLPFCLLFMPLPEKRE